MQSLELVNRTLTVRDLFPVFGKHEYLGSRKKLNKILSLWNNRDKEEIG